MKCKKCDGVGGTRRRVKTTVKSLVNGEEVPVVHVPVVHYESKPCIACKGAGWVMTKEDNPLFAMSPDGTVAGVKHRCKGCGADCFRVDLNLSLVLMTCVNCGLKAIVLSEVALMPPEFPVRVGLRTPSEFNEGRYLRLIEQEKEK